MVRKATSAAVASIAARVLRNAEQGRVSPFRSGIKAAVRDCGVPLNQATIDAIVAKIELAISPIFDDAEKLAASCLGQAEAKSDFDAGDEELAGN